MTIRERLRALYLGDTPIARAYGYFLLGFDIAMIAYVIGSSFLLGTMAIEIIDALLGCFIIFDFSARLIVSRRPWRTLLEPATIADVIVILSLLAPVTGEGFAFLRVVRTLQVGS